MPSKHAFLDGQWLPSDSRITYQNFEHWEKAMRQSREMAQSQANGQHLRHLSAPRASADNESQFAHDFDPEAVVIRLARNRPALLSLRRTHKTRYRQNLDRLSASFPLADEVKKESERAQGCTPDVIHYQEEVAKNKRTQMAIEEIKYMKTAKMKAKVEQRNKNKATRTGATGKKDEKATRTSTQKTAGKSLEKSAQKTTEKTAKKVVDNVGRKRYVGTAVNTDERPAPFNMFIGKHIMPVSKTAGKSTAENTEKAAAKSIEKSATKGTEKSATKSTEKSAAKGTEKPAAKSTKKTAPKSTGSSAARKSGKKTLRAKMMPAPEAKRW